MKVAANKVTPLESQVLAAGHRAGKAGEKVTVAGIIRELKLEDCKPERRKVCSAIWRMRKRGQWPFDPERGPYRPRDRADDGLEVVDLTRRFRRHFESNGHVEAPPGPPAPAGPDREAATIARVLEAIAALPDEGARRRVRAYLADRLAE